MDIRFRCPHCGGRRVERDELDPNEERIICSKCLREIKPDEIDAHLEKAINKVISAVKAARDK
ncbi:ECs_2282 family putative zinc-binding protein [Enterobacter ludwigii]|uniref:ECs_2282 family putative zinc-binding protein n=1 Tax=Enterobacter ludwigii TaxID=299767 RepID=UPI003BEF1AF0